MIKIKYFLLGILVILLIYQIHDLYHRVSNIEQYLTYISQSSHQ